MALKAFYGAMLAALGVLCGCGGGDNETPADFDPEEIVLVRVEPGNGESGVPRNFIIRMTFNTVVLPESVDDQSVRVRIGGTFQTRPDGSFVVNGNVIDFDPTVDSSGGPNAAGLPAGTQVLVEVPVFTPGGGEPENNFVQNVEGNPMAVATGDSAVSFTTGTGWLDKVPGSPGVLGLDFVPGPDSVGQVPPNAAVTVIFDEPMDPASVILGSNIFVTNATDTAPNFQQDIPSNVFFDGSLTRFTFLPVFGFGKGPFTILVNFIDPDDPGSFDPIRLPTDLGGNQLINFTFAETFDTQFDADTRTTTVILEDFTTSVQRDVTATTALWGDDPEEPFTLIGQPVSTRTQTVNVNAILNLSGGTTAIPDSGGPTNEGRFCPLENPLVGLDFVPGPPNLATLPPANLGRRIQNLYRQAELGPEGTIIRAGWGPSADRTFAATYDRVVIRFGHKVPGTSLTPSTFFDQFDVDSFTEVIDAEDYRVTAQTDVNGGMINDGFFNWPEFDRFFEYDGQNDLLMDVEATPGTTTNLIRTFYAVNGNGCTCAALFNDTGACTYNNSIGLRQMEGVFGSNEPNPDPENPPPGILNPSPSVQIMQFVMQNLRSVGTSLYYDSGTDDPDYLPAILQPLVQPGGGGVSVRFSGSMDGITEDVPFTADINAVDGFRFIRFEITLRANSFTLGRARVERIEIPVVFAGP